PRLSRAMPSLGGAVRVRATRVAGFAAQGIIAALAVHATDRMDGREVKHIEAKRGDVRQTVDAIVKSAVLARNGGLAAWHHLVPSGCPRNRPIRQQRKVGASSKIRLLPFAGRRCELIGQ